MKQMLLTVERVDQFAYFFFMLLWLLESRDFERIDLDQLQDKMMNMVHLIRHAKGFGSLTVDIS